MRPPALLLLAAAAAVCITTTARRAGATTTHAHRSGCNMTFAYLIQGPEYADDPRLTPSRCRHIFWLTFRTPSPHPHHLHMPGSTWTQGRNALLAHAQAAGHHDYYVFMDDDALRMVTVDTNRAPGVQPYPASFTPWDVFETRLAQHRPAVGYMTRYSWQTGDDARDITLGRGNVDAIVNAFHASTVGVLVPYDATFDEQSWYYSQLINCFMVAALYPSHRVGFNELGFDDGHNKHRYSEDKRLTDWTVGKRYMRTLVRDGTESAVGVARAMCFATDNNDLCDWRACPQPPPPTYALDCGWVERAVNASHPLAAGWKKACVSGGWVPRVPLFYDVCA